MNQILATKSREQLLASSREEHAGHGSGLARSLQTADLLAIGVGSTVGTGVFSITGQVAREQAGPAVLMCWILGGLGCLLSAVSYVELSARLPATGSVYAFAFNALGEVFAVVAAACITLEYGIAASAVAANWSDKFKNFVAASGAPRFAAHLSVQLGPLTLSAPALVVLLLVTVLIAAGGALGKVFTRGSPVLAVILILGMSAVALAHFESSHFAPFVPPEMGAQGVLAGTVTTFFGFLGYDEVCCLAGEAADPRRSIPRSVFGTILLATLLPVLGSLGLVGLSPYTEIDSGSGYEVAFRREGWMVLSHIVCVGELLVLFVIIYMCFMAQPRVFYALAKDGLLPAFFLDVDARGSPRSATYATGVLLIICGVLLPFGVLANAISGGVLISFDLVNCCLIMVRHSELCDGSSHQSPFSRSSSTSPSMGSCLGIYVVSSALVSILATRTEGSWVAVGLMSLATIAALASLGLVARTLRGRHACTEASGAAAAPNAGAGPFFRVPCVPWIPALAIAFNNFMLASLKARDFALLGSYLASILALYLAGAWRQGRRRGQESGSVSLAEG